MTTAAEQDHRRHRCGDCAKRGVEARFEHDADSGELVCPSCGTRVSTRATAYWSWALIILGVVVIAVVERLLCSP